MPLIAIQGAVDVQIHRIEDFLLGLGKIFLINSTFQDDEYREAITRAKEKVLKPGPIVVNIQI
jgi:hypothetical protein